MTNWQTSDALESETIDVARKLSGLRINFWGMKLLWRRERQYVAIPVMAVWQRPDMPDEPDGWSFADVKTKTSKFKT
jgi:hypothetical protein